MKLKLSWQDINRRKFTRRNILQVSGFSLGSLFLPISNLAATVSDKHEIIILATTDIHAHIWAEFATQGSWLKIMTKVREVRKKHGADRVLLLDCGDTCQGTIVSAMDRGRLSMRMLKESGVDLWVPGNHELDYGVKQFRQYMKVAGDIVICGNLQIDDKFLPSYKIIKKGGLRVAVIGMTSSFLGNWYCGLRKAGVTWEAAVAGLRRVLPKVLRQNPDMMVLAMHQGLKYRDSKGVNEVAKIAELFPEIDLIIGGHTHRNYSGEMVGKRTWYVQAGAYAEKLAMIEVKVKGRGDQGVKIVSQLFDVKNLTEDKVLKKALAADYKKVVKFSKQVICCFDHDLDISNRPGEGCEVSSLVARALCAGSGAKIALHGRHGSFKIKKGAMTEVELLKIMPYENFVVTAELTVAQLRLVVAEQKQWRGSYRYNAILGCDDWEKLRSSQRIKMVCNAYIAAGAGGNFPVVREILRTPQAKMKVHNLRTRDLVRNFLKKKRD